MTAPAQEPEDTAFSALARQLYDVPVTDKPDPRGVRLLERVIARLAQPGSAETEAGLQAALRPYRRALEAAARPGDAASLTTYSRLEARVARSKGRCAVVVTIGAVSRLAVFDAATGRRLTVPTAFEWLIPWQSDVVFLNNGNLLLISQSVQDMGNRTAFRVDLLEPDAGDYRLAWSRRKIATLEFGGADLTGSRLKLVSIGPAEIVFYLRVRDAV